MTSQLPNYLRANRKRLALSQNEVSFLLGTQNAANVCRYECFIREPSLETALAYEVMFQKPARELFPGLYRKVQDQVAARAKALTYQVERKRSNQHTIRRRQTLDTIAASTTKDIADQL